MTDRPIIFSAAMVRALLAGDKTQTRRLASSPLSKCENGDRLYVREAFRFDPLRDEDKPSKVVRGSRVEYNAQDDNPMMAKGKLRPSIFMPKWASRMTLEITDVKFERLETIDSHDAKAEGIQRRLSLGHAPILFKDYSNPKREDWLVNPKDSFKSLWDSLHGEKPSEAWANNPDVVALTFQVKRGNIDAL